MVLIFTCLATRWGDPWWVVMVAQLGWWKPPVGNSMGEVVANPKWLTVDEEFKASPSSQM